MLNYNYYLKKNKKFIFDLKNIDIKYFNSQLLMDFKKYEIGINPFSDKFINLVFKTIKKVIKKINNINIKKDFIKYINEVKIINDLYKGFYNSIINQKIEKIIKYGSLFNYLQFISYSKIDFIELNNEVRNNLKNHFLYNKKLEKKDFNRTDNEEIISITESNILKYYIHKKYYNKFPDKFYYKNFNRFISSFFNFYMPIAISSIRILDNILQTWKLNCLKINDGKSFELINIDKLKEFKAVTIMYLVQANEISKEGYFFQNVKAETTFGNFIHSSEYDSYLDLINIFFDKKLNIPLLKINLDIWLRFITLIILKAEENLILDKNAKNFIFIQDEKIWIEYFTQNGINYSDAKIMIDAMTFNEKSEDFYDAPFIKCDRGLAILPAIACYIKPSRTILTIITRNSASLEKKGDNFEKYIYKLLDDLNLQYISIKIKQNKEEYQCDLVFIHKSEIYICELKNIFTPHSYKKYLQNIETRDKNIKQINRLYDFYINNDYIEKEFKNKYNNKSKYNNKLNPIKMIIYSFIIEKNFYEDNVLITDIINFRDYFFNKNVDSSRNISIKDYLLNNYRYNYLIGEYIVKTDFVEIPYNLKRKKIKMQFLIDNYINEILNRQSLDNSGIFEAIESYAHAWFYLYKDNFLRSNIFLK